jgi:hypothetical protein
MPDNRRSKRQRFISMNLLNGSVQIIIARGYWKAFKKAKAYFGNKPIKVWPDTFSTR